MSGFEVRVIEVEDEGPKVDNEALEKKRGRPKGSKRDPSLPIKYPIGWKVVYDQMIMHYLQGKTYAEIGGIVGYTEVQVGNIIRSPQGQAILSEIAQGIKEFTKEQVVSEAEKRAEITRKALDKMEGFIENKGIEELSPLHYVDRVIKIANTVNGVGGAKKIEGVVNNNTVNVQNNTVLMPSEAINALTKALEISNRLGLPTRDKEIRQREDHDGR